jgi:hypothetical protein
MGTGHEQEDLMVNEHPPQAEAGREGAEIAIHRIRLAEQALADAREQEARAGRDLEVAVEELGRLEHGRVFWIVVNARRKEVHERHLSFARIVELAFPDAPSNENIMYTVSYRNGASERHPEGTLVAGQSVRIKDGTIFDVTATNKS